MPSLCHCTSVFRGPNAVATRVNSPAFIFRRHATSAARNPQLLEKPTKYNPPSHGTRLLDHTMRTYGPELTEQELLSQSKRYYPNMTPPEGTFLHWFSMKNALHMWIIGGTLTAMGLYSAWENWCRSTIFYNGLPKKENILRRPRDSAWQFFIACLRSEQEKSKKPNWRRERRVEDICKQASYRKATGGEKHQDIEFWPEFERRHGDMVISPQTGRLVDQDTLPDKGVRWKTKRWFGFF